jgi:hypothetical protein
MTSHYRYITSEITVKCIYVEVPILSIPYNEFVPILRSASRLKHSALSDTGEPESGSTPAGGMGPTQRSKWPLEGPIK